MTLELTKEMLLKRVLALKDGAVINDEILSILTTPDDDPNVIDSIKRLHRTAYSENASIYVGEETYQNCNDIVKLIEKTYPNVIDIKHVCVGINPKDPTDIIERGGQGYFLYYKQMGYHPIKAENFQLRTDGSTEDIVMQVGGLIKRHKWEYVYLYSVSKVWGINWNNNLDMTCVIKIGGITQEEIDRLSTINIEPDFGDYIESGKVNIILPQVG